MKTILVPTNFSGYATDAVVTAASIVRATGGKLVLMHNVETLLTNWANLSVQERLKHPDVIVRTANIQRELDEITQGGLLYGLNVESLITYGVTSDEILRTAKNTNSSLIVMGFSDNKGSGRDFIGSTLQRVARQASCPVLSVRKEIGAGNWKKLLIPVSLDFDVSVPFDEIARVSQELGSTIQLLYINTPQHFRDALKTKKLMEDFKAKYPQLPIETATYYHPEVEEGILEFAKLSNVDYIAMITFEHRHAPGYQLSTTDHILYHSPVPVLTVYEGVDRLKNRRVELA